MPVSRFDKLLDAILMFMTHMTQKEEPTSLTEEQMTHAMLEALRQGKSFIRPRTFAGGGG